MNFLYEPSYTDRDQDGGLYRVLPDALLLFSGIQKGPFLFSIEKYVLGLQALVGLFFFFRNTAHPTALFNRVPGVYKNIVAGSLIMRDVREGNFNDAVRISKIHPFYGGEFNNIWKNCNK